MKDNNGKIIGILGGGQLGKMLCDEAKQQGYKTIVLDPSENICSKKSADIHIKSNYEDKKGLQKLAIESSLITYEFENVPVDAVKILKEYKGNIPQGELPLAICQNRIKEKEIAKYSGLNTVKYEKIEDIAAFLKIQERIKFPIILKTVFGGYDGKGQWVIENLEELQEIVKHIKEDIKNGKKYIIEEKINLKQEVSCLVVRNAKGEVINFPISENIHKNGILHLSIVPARISEELQNKIIEKSKRMIEKLNFIGPLAIEFFIDNEENIYFNEMAPRPHNSFHYSMDACDKSQFNLHIKSLFDEKLNQPKLIKNCVMLNILGQDKEKIDALIENKNFDKGIEYKIHIYGKDEWIKNRKMGHINFYGNNSIDIILDNIKKIKE